MAEVAEVARPLLAPSQKWQTRPLLAPSQTSTMPIQLHILQTIPDNCQYIHYHSTYRRGLVALGGFRNIDQIF